MFGHQDSSDDEHKIPEDNIDEALKAVENSGDQSLTSDSWQHPGEPLDQISHGVSDDNTEHAGNNSSNIADIKQQALEELSPLVEHLDQSPEEKFKTTMMLIQASDNQDLIPKAYSIAKQITDDSKRAQALLDVVNEINYFTNKTPAA